MKAKKKKLSASPANYYVCREWDTYSRKYQFRLVSKHDMCCNSEASTPSHPTKYYAVGGEIVVTVKITEKK